MTQFWFEYLPAMTRNPNLWIGTSMPFNEQLNAISRMILMLTLFGFMATRNPKILIGGFVSLGVTAFLWYSKRHALEGFDGTSMPSENFTKPTKENPLMNVTYADDPERPRAAPSFDPDIERDINAKTKQIITQGDREIEEELFGSLGDEAEFKHSMRAFHPTANTQIPNDQAAFLKFCYGDEK